MQNLEQRIQSAYFKHVLNAYHDGNVRIAEKSLNTVLASFWGRWNGDDWDTNKDTDTMIEVVIPNLTNCLRFIETIWQLETVANGIRNSYYDGHELGYRGGYEDGYSEGFETAMDEERG